MCCSPTVVVTIRACVPATKTLILAEVRSLSSKISSYLIHGLNRRCLLAGRRNLNHAIDHISNLHSRRNSAVDQARVAVVQGGGKLDTAAIVVTKRRETDFDVWQIRVTQNRRNSTLHDIQA